MSIEHKANSREVRRIIARRATTHARGSRTTSRDRACRLPVIADAAWHAEEAHGRAIGSREASSIGIAAQNRNGKAKGFARANRSVECVRVRAARDLHGTNPVTDLGIERHR